MLAFSKESLGRILTYIEVQWQGGVGVNEDERPANLTERRSKRAREVRSCDIPDPVAVPVGAPAPASSPSLRLAEVPGENKQQGDADVAESDERPAKRTKHHHKRNAEEDASAPAAAPYSTVHLAGSPAPAPSSDYHHPQGPVPSLHYAAPPDASAQTVASLAAALTNLTSALHSSRTEAQAKMAELEQQLAYYKAQASRRD